MGHPVYERLKSEKLLPSPKGVAMEVLRLVDLETSSVEEIASVIERDPSLASRLIKLVNSPLTRTARPIVSLQVAATLLGLRSIKNLALCFSLVGEHRTGPCVQFDYGLFWSASLARAVGASQLARSVGGFAPDEAFSCGLLGGIGQLALASAFPESYGGTVAVARQEGVEGALTRLEREFYEIDHNTLSVELMRDWRMPQVFLDAVGAQDAPGAMPPECGDRSRQLARILFLAGVMADLLIRSSDRQDALGVIVRESSRMNVAPEQLEDLFKAVGSTWRELGQLYTIETRSVLTLSELYALAAQQRWKLEQHAPPRDEPSRA